jgi:hypothetical protein
MKPAGTQQADSSRRLSAPARTTAHGVSEQLSRKAYEMAASARKIWAVELHATAPAELLYKNRPLRARRRR